MLLKITAVIARETLRKLIAASGNDHFVTCQGVSGQGRWPGSASRLRRDSVVVPRPAGLRGRCSQNRLGQLRQIIRRVAGQFALPEQFGGLGMGRAALSN